MKNKNMGAPLSKELRAKHGVRTLPVRVNDEVRIRKGEYAGATGKVFRLHGSDTGNGRCTCKAPLQHVCSHRQGTNPR